MCETKASVPVGAIATGIGAVAAAGTVVAAAVSLWPLLLAGAVATAVITIAAVRVLSRHTVVYWPSRVVPAKRTARVRRALPVPPKAIEAPKTVPVYVITDAMVRGVNPAHHHKAGAR